MVSTISKRQSVIAQSSTETEYYSGAKTGQESEYLCQVLAEMGYKGEDTQCIEFHEDNQSALALAENPEFHQYMKYIVTKYYYLCNRVEKGQIELFYISMEDMVVDGLTKPLGTTKYTRFIEFLNL